MRSRSVHTLLIDDTDAAAKELAGRLQDGFALGKQSVGILYTYSDMEVAELAQALQAIVPFPVIGCTCIASMDNGGFMDMAATLTVLTADDCTFAAEVSASITPENVQAEIDSTYRRVTEALGSAPGLLFVLPPYSLDIMLDYYPERFNAIAPGVPVVGGLPSYNGTGDVNATLAGGQATPDRMVVLGIGGNIRPVFSVQNVTGVDVERKRKVTSAKDNVVYTVNGEPFTDYLRAIGLPVEELTQGNTTVTFVSNPLILESSEGGGYAFARTLHAIDLADGSGTAIGQVPEGATLAVCSLQGEQIVQAAQDGAQALVQLMQGEARDGYQFSTVMAISCIGRHLLLIPDNARETAKLMEGLPPGLTLTGFYSYGEIGPQGKQQRNFAHNESLVLCAF
ncbi:MAG: hypothetical protein GXY32_07995 [Ruminococcaceae bacterium]|mgnify:FL=1|nr:hypothetical protein [Oscillospiraceae bacterium]